MTPRRSSSVPSAKRPFTARVIKSPESPRSLKGDGGPRSVASCGLHRLGHLRRFVYAGPGAACGAACWHVAVWNHCPATTCSTFARMKRGQRVWQWLGGGIRLNCASAWRINNLFSRCTMLHSAQGTGPTVNSSFPTPLSNSGPAPSGVFGSLAGSL